MLIIGAGGLTRDVITSWEMDSRNNGVPLVLFDNINTEVHLLYDKYPILHSTEQVQEHFETFGRRFFVCIGNPLKRKRVTESIELLGGEPWSYISDRSVVLSQYTHVGAGSVIEPGVMISRDVHISKGVFLNSGTIVGHDVVLNDYVSVGPGVRLLGGSHIGECSYVGCNAVVMPGVKVGSKVRIGVGKIIDKDIPDNSKII